MAAAPLPRPRRPRDYSHTPARRTNRNTGRVAHTTRLSDHLHPTAWPRATSGRRRPGDCLWRRLRDHHHDDTEAIDGAPLALTYVEITTLERDDLVTVLAAFPEARAMVACAATFYKCRIALRRWAARGNEKGKKKSLISVAHEAMQHRGANPNEDDAIPASEALIAPMKTMKALEKKTHAVAQEIDANASRLELNTARLDANASRLGAMEARMGSVETILLQINQRLRRAEEERAVDRAAAEGDRRGRVSLCDQASISQDRVASFDCVACDRVVSHK